MYSLSKVQKPLSSVLHMIKYYPKMGKKFSNVLVLSMQYRGCGTVHVTIVIQPVSTKTKRF